MKVEKESWVVGGEVVVKEVIVNVDVLLAKISWSSLGAGGSKDSQESTILLAVASTISKATQGLGGRGGRFLFRRGTKMGEEMMREGRRFGEGE